MWRTKFTIELVHRFGEGRITLEKTVDGAVMPTADRDANVFLVIGPNDLNADVQSVSILVDEQVVSIRSKYVQYDVMEEMNQEADQLRQLGWED